jgi:hypothetical protein
MVPSNVWGRLRTTGCKERKDAAGEEEIGKEDEEEGKEEEIEDGEINDGSLYEV